MRTRTLFRKFLREDERGGITILMLVLFVGILLLTGISLDLAKHETQRASLQSALDRGVLAVASVRGGAREEDARSIIESYVATRPFALNSFTYVDPIGMSADDLAALDGAWLALNADLDNLNSRKVTAAAAFPMDTTFLRLAGLADIDVVGQAEAIQQVQNVEVSLILDISGTMRWTKGGNTPPEGESRMEKLKPAAIEFIETLTNNGESEFVTVNLVPYSGGVNIGQTAYSILTGRTVGEDPLVSMDLQQLALVDLGIGHRTLEQLDLDVIEEDLLEDLLGIEIDLSPFGVGELADLTPQQLADAGIVLTLAHAAAAGVNMYEIDWSNVNRDEINLPHDLIHPFSFCLDIDQYDQSEYSNLAVPEVGVHTRQVGHFNYYGYNRFAHGNQIMEWGWCPSAETEMTYMTNDLDQVSDAIDRMLMNDGTSTYAAMKWGLAMLHPDSQWFVDEMAAYGKIDPRFASYGEDPRPAAFDTGNTMKYVVLMTDGNVNHDFRLDDREDPNWWHDTRPAGGSNTYTRMSQANGRTTFLQMCEDARTEFTNLRIFTIAFDTNSTSIDNEMRSCASSASDFFQADTLNIAETFQVIAAKIEDLKLTN